MAGYSGPVFNPGSTVTNTETARGHATCLGRFHLGVGGERERSQHLQVAGTEVQWAVSTENGDTVTGTLRTK